MILASPVVVPAAGQRSPAAVSAKLSFIVPSEAKPVFYSSAHTGGPPRVLFDSERHVVAIDDMRPSAGTLSLDHEGFELRPHATAVDDLYDDAAVETLYFPEIEALVREATGAGRVVVFDATRRSDGGTGAPNRDGRRGPATRVHVDYTATSGPRRAADILGQDVMARLGGSGTRILQVNVWRPIHGPVQRSPLAVADASSVRAADLIATDQVFPDRVGEIYHLAYHPAQRWYFAPQMTRGEVLLIKGWDSLDDGRARFTPHGAFDLPDTPADAAPRESIEVRTFAVIDAGRARDRAGHG